MRKDKKISFDRLDSYFNFVNRTDFTFAVFSTF